MTDAPPLSRGARGGSCRENCRLTAGLPAFLIAAILLGGILGCATTRPLEEPLPEEMDREQAIEHARELMESEMDRLDIPGAAVAVSDADGTIWTEGFGKAGEEREFAPETVTNIGSVSKLFTGIAVMRLVEEGEVDLDAPLSEYLPEFEPRTRGAEPDDITVRSVLSHHSGLARDYFADWMVAESFADVGRRPYAETAALASETAVAYEPYTVWSYSNLGYELLGLVVEAASGEDFNDYVMQEILEPAGMDSSSFVYREEQADGRQLGFAPGSCSDRAFRR